MSRPNAFKISGQPVGLGVHMDAVQWIVVWGAVAVFGGAVGGLMALMKNRDISHWMAWCFLVPPLVLILALLPRREPPPPKRPTLDEEDRARD